MVEDDEDVVEFSRALLEKHNYSFEVATDGEAALVAYMTRRPDLLLLDVFVPRLDGLRFAREIQHLAAVGSTPQRRCPSTLAP